MFDFNNLSLRKYGVAALLASCCPPFALGVVIIFGQCSQPEMAWVDAHPIISTGAVVAHAHSFWNRDSVVEFPRKNMGTFPEVSALNPAIAIVALIKGPNPTAFGLVDLAPEISDRIFYSQGFRVALLSAVFDGVSFVCGTLENLTASETFKLWHLKTFLSDVKRGSGYNRCLALQG